MRVPNEGDLMFIGTADPSWYEHVLRTLAVDYPEISRTVWEKTITKKAIERTTRNEEKQD
jgi:hypothetical protein